MTRYLRIRIFAAAQLYTATYSCTRLRARSVLECRTLSTLVLHRTRVQCKKNSCSIDARPASAGGVQIGDRERSSLARSLARGIRTAVFIIYNCIYIIVRGSSQLGSTPSAWLSSYSRRVPQQNAYSRSSRRSWTRALRVCFLSCLSSGSSSDAVPSVARIAELERYNFLAENHDGFL